MSWNLSRYRAGDLVEVCSKEEILATLDDRGCVEGMPFMPEMLQFCGRRFRVRAVAHKTCTPGRGHNRGRRIDATVHLENLRCDGSAHGGCEADCTLFWKDCWLKPAGNQTAADAPPQSAAAGCSEAQLLASTKLTVLTANNEPYYCCQATQICEASHWQAWWDPRQYLWDVGSRNYSPGRVLRVMLLATLRFPWRVIRRIPVVRTLYAPLNEAICRLLTGREGPYLFKKTKPLTGKTPTGRLDLKPGEIVRVKPKREIETTLDARGMNRGMTFDPEEMGAYCGGTFRVRSCVTRILDEKTGEMLHMKQPCIILEGVVCRSEYTRYRLNCPRAIPAYWREIWLERVPEGEEIVGCSFADQTPAPAEASN